MERTYSQARRNHPLHPARPPRDIVCVYARADEQYLRELQRHLYLYVRQQKIRWLDVQVGEASEQILRGHLRRAYLILLLVSTDLLADDAPYESMLAAIAEYSRRQVPVVPMLARTSAWKDSACSAFQALPEDERPIVEWEQRDKAYESIRQGLLRILPEIQTNTPAPTMTPENLSEALDFRARDLPGEYVARSGILARIKYTLLGEKRSQTTALTTALQGAGGFGKTTLALALCHDPEIQAAFPDGILWIELGEEPPRPLDLLNNLLARIGSPRQAALTLDEARVFWQAALSEKTCLLVVDDVWQTEALTPLLEGGPYCQRLVTTRYDQVLSDEATRVVVDAMEPDEALALLSQGLPAEAQHSTAQMALAGLAQRLGYWPLLLSMARGLLATHLRYGSELGQALAVVEHVYHARPAVSTQVGPASGFDEAVDAGLQASLYQLQHVVSARFQPLERFQELAIFPEDTDIPIGELRLFWHVTLGMASWEADHLCMQLHSLSLVLTCDLEAGTLRLHDVVRTALVQQVGAHLPQLHSRFLAALKQGLSVNQWAEVSLTNRYLWQFLVFHLCHAQQWEELAQLLGDLRYIVAKAWVCGVSELEGELAQVVALSTFLRTSPQERSPEQQTLDFLERIQRHVSLVSHLLRRCVTLVELGSVALSYLRWEAPFVEQGHRLEEALPRPYLTSWHPLPQQFTSALLRTLSGHRSGVFGCAISPDGSFIVSASYDHTLKVWDVTIGAERFSLVGHSGPVRGCAVSPDGSFVVSASDDGVLKVWDTAIGEERFSLVGHRGPVRGCAVSPDSSWIVSASNDGMLKIWDVTIGEERFSLVGHRGPVRGCAVSPDGSFIVSASDDRTLKIWDVTTREERFSLVGHRGSVRGCAISPDGNFIISASEDRTLKVWNVATGEERFSLVGHRTWTTGCAVSPDGSFIVSASADRTLKVWNVATGEERFSLVGHRLGVFGCAVSPDGNFIVSASNDYTLKVWNAATGVEHFSPLSYHHKVRDCVMSPDSSFIISDFDDGTLKVWNAATGEERFSLVGHHGPVRNCAVSPDGNFIVSVSDENTLKVWDAATGEECFSCLIHSDWGFNYMVSPDGSFIVFASANDTLKVWDTSTKTERFSLVGHHGLFRGYTVSPDSKFLISNSISGRLTAWDTATGEERFSLVGHHGPVTACAVSPDGNFIVSASEDCTLKVWNVATGEERFSLDVSNAFDTVCTVSPDSSFIVSGAFIGRLTVWNATTGKKLLSFKSSSLWSNSWVVSPDSNFIVSTSAGRMLKVWDAATGAKRFSASHSKRITGCAVSPSSNVIVSVSEDRTLKVWDAAIGHNIQTFPVDGKLECCMFLPDGKHLVAGGETGLYWLRLME